MKLLVTGGAGFIGSNFIGYWLSHYPDDHIINLDALTYAGTTANVADLEDHPHYTFVKGNITNSARVDTIMKDVDTVVHFAAESHVDRSIQDALPFLQTNVIGTQILLNSALKHKNIKRFHHISTDEVFGSLELDSSEKFTEDTPYNPRNPYSASKAASDHLVRAAYETHGLPMTISNCSNNYGPYHHPEKMIPRAITRLMQGKKVPVYGDGNYVRDWLYVIDHARAIDQIVHDGTVGETYLIGGLRDDITNLELVKMIVSIMDMDESMIEFVKDRPGHDRRYAVDWSYINRELGWEPQVSLEEGLRKTIEWYASHSDYARA